MKSDLIDDGEAMADGGPLSVAEREAQTDLYCIWNVDRNAVKIGISGNTRRRFQQLQTASCDKLVFWARFPGGRIAEEVWHKALASLRMQGEWFDASDGVILKGFLETALKYGGGPNHD